MIAPPDSVNEQVAKLLLSKNLLALDLKQKRRVASRDMHASSYLRIILATTPSAFYVLGVVARMIFITRCICACVLAIDLDFVTTPRVLHICV